MNDWSPPVPHASEPPEPASPTPAPGISDAPGVPDLSDAPGVPDAPGVQDAPGLPGNVASPGQQQAPSAPAQAPDLSIPAGQQTMVHDPIVPGSLLEARDVSAWFGAHKVLERVSLSMPPGVVTALIGPSGCGKSTFLRILNRMHETTHGAQLAGSVFLNGADIYTPGTRVTQTRNRIGMVFQKPNPFPAMSIAENVVAGLRLTGIRMSRRNRAETIERCLLRAGLWAEVKDRLANPGGALSGGQQQRLCIARSLAVNPGVLLMDEPCSALDPGSTARIEQTIHDLRSDVTIVIVTHNMQQAVRVSQQCAFFLAEGGAPGGIVESGDTAQVFDAPRDPRTADYVHGRFG